MQGLDFEGRDQGDPPPAFRTAADFHQHPAHRSGKRQAVKKTGLRPLNRELRALRDARLRYEQGDQELKDAVANLSHDLRTPLTSICGYLDLLENTEKSPQAERYLELVRNRADFLRKQLEELFGYSLAASAPEGEPELLSLNSVLEESLAAFYGAMAGRRITPDISMPEKRVERYVNRSRLFSR